MKIIDIAGSSISKELLLVYSLIGLVIILIITVLIIDKVSSRKKDNLFDSRKLSKRLNDLKMEAEKDENPIPTEKEIVSETSMPKETQEIIEEEIPILDVPTTIAQSQPEVLTSVGIETPKEESIMSHPVVSTSELSVDSDDDEIYIEDDLEKTQAQIAVEAITKELNKAVQDEKNLDKYAKFEEEQEQSAIISYTELKEKFDELYDEGEKVQYLDDDHLPINIEELYQNKVEIETPKIVKMDDFHTITPETVHAIKSSVRTTGFKSSPMISPVYGIQQEPTMVSQGETNFAELDQELKRTNEFLTSLKDLQKNLE